MPISKAVRLGVPLAGLAGAGLLVVSGAASGADFSLYGTRWLAEDIQQRGVIDYLQTTLSIDDEGGVAGLAGCNRYAGSISSDGMQLAFSPLASTRMACMPVLDDQEQRFFEALGRTTQYRIDREGLRLLDAEGEEVLRFSEME